MPALQSHQVVILLLYALLLTILLSALASGVLGGLLFAYSYLAVNAVIERADESWLRRWQGLRRAVFGPRMCLLLLGTIACGGATVWTTWWVWSHRSLW